MTKYYVNVDVKPRELASAYVNAPFDEGKEILEQEGFKIISLEENARLRMQEGADAYVSKNKNWVKEDAIYIPKKGIFLTKNSLIMENLKQAVESYRRGLNFYLTPRQVEYALSDSVELSAKSIPTDRLAECEITAYAFGEYAQEYGLFLRESLIREISIFTENLKEKPFAKKIKLGDIDYGCYGSALCCDFMGLDKRCRVRGVREL